MNFPGRALTKLEHTCSLCVKLSVCSNTLMAQQTALINFVL